MPEGIHQINYGGMQECASNEASLFLVVMPN